MYLKIVNFLKILSHGYKADTTLLFILIEKT